MLKKVVRVNLNLTIIFYTHREPIYVTSDDNSALETAMKLLTHLTNFTDDDLEPTMVLGQAS